MTNQDEEFFWTKFQEYQTFLVSQLKCNRDREKYKSVYILFKSIAIINKPSLYYYLNIIDELYLFIQDSYSYNLMNNDKKIMIKACEHIQDLIQSFQTRYKL